MQQNSKNLFPFSSFLLLRAFSVACFVTFSVALVEGKDGILAPRIIDPLDLKKCPVFGRYSR